MLDEHWEGNPELHSTVIYQASGLAMKALTVYQTYIEMMNEEIKRSFQIRNPFNFKFVQHLKSLVGFRDSTPCVVLATPSMLQSGISRELFDLWCADPKHGVIIADFAVQVKHKKSKNFEKLKNQKKNTKKLKIYFCIGYIGETDFGESDRGV